MPSILYKSLLTVAARRRSDVSDIKKVMPMQKITPFLWFDHQAEEAMHSMSRFSRIEASSVCVAMAKAHLFLPERS